MQKATTLLSSKFHPFPRKFSNYGLHSLRSNAQQKMFKHFCNSPTVPSSNVAFLACIPYDRLLITDITTGCFSWKTCSIFGRIDITPEVYVIFLYFQANWGTVTYLNMQPTLPPTFYSINYMSYQSSGKKKLYDTKNWECR